MDFQEFYRGESFDAYAYLGAAAKIGRAHV